MEKPNFIYINLGMRGQQKSPLFRGMECKDEVEWGEQATTVSELSVVEN